MKTIECQVCHKQEIPLNKALKIDGVLHCEECLDSLYPDQSQLEGKEVVHTLDLTVCSNCQTDFGNTELGTIANYPICDNCKLNIDKKVFPLWVKAFMLGLCILIIGAFVWNWKYYDAYKNLNKASDFMAIGDPGKAALYMEKASIQVPQSLDLMFLTAYYKGIHYLTIDESESAMNEFMKCRNNLPSDFNVDDYILQAKIGMTFDNHDYHGFLDACFESLKQDSTDAYRLTAVASAYACLFVSESKEEDLNLSTTYLNKAKSIDNTSQALLDYYNKVEYRLFSKTIITSQEFDVKFPDGWKLN